MTVPDGVRISVVDHGEITRRGSVLARIDAGVDPFPERGWGVWHRGTLAPLAPPDEALAIFARDMSEQEHVVASVQTCEDAPRCVEPYIWADGQPTVILPEGQSGEAIAVNDHGQALVERQSGLVPGAPGPLPPEPFETTIVWDDGRILTPPATGAIRKLPVDINNRGQVALMLHDPSGERPGRAGIWQVDGRRGVVDLGTLPGYDARPAVINDRGHVAGRVETDYGRTAHAVVWRGGELVELGDLGGGWSAAEAINERGDVLGRSTTADQQVRFFLWRRGRLIDLGPIGATALNNRGQVVGAGLSDVPGVMHALLWHEGRVIDLGAIADPQQPSFAYDINDRGQILGEVGGRPVIWTIHPPRSEGAHPSG
jgi:probable HAF family extracellular repeat protein